VLENAALVYLSSCFQNEYLKKYWAVNRSNNCLQSTDILMMISFTAKMIANWQTQHDQCISHPVSISRLTVEPVQGCGWIYKRKFQLKLNKMWQTDYQSTWQRKTVACFSKNALLLLLLPLLIIIIIKKRTIKSCHNRSRADETMPQLLNTAMCVSVGQVITKRLILLADFRVDVNIFSCYVILAAFTHIPLRLTLILFGSRRHFL